MTYTNRLSQNLMKSAGVSFKQNSTVDSVATKPGPDVAVPSFERSLEDFSHNCDALLYELVGFCL